MPIYPSRVCGCGCGGTVARNNTFLQGHNRTAVLQRITAGWGDELGFISWFDAQHPGWRDKENTQ